MKNKTKFKKIFDMLTDHAKMNLVYHPYSSKDSVGPMTMNVLYLEIINDTKLGKKVLNEMFKNEN